MKKYTDLKTFEDACEYLQLDAKKVIPDFAFYPEKDKEAMIAHAKLVIINKAANQLANNGEEYTPNWEDYNEYKYYPWFDMNDSSAASRFSYGDYVTWGTDSAVGSRLCFINYKVAEYTGKQFIDLYRAYFVR